MNQRSTCCNKTPRTSGENAPETAKEFKMTVITYDMLFKSCTNDPKTIFQHMQTSDFLRRAMVEVEENNQINGGRWADWSDWSDIALAYDLEPEYPHDARYLRLIIDLNTALEANQ